MPAKRPLPIPMQIQHVQEEEEEEIGVEPIEDYDSDVEKTSKTSKKARKIASDYEYDSSDDAPKKPPKKVFAMKLLNPKCRKKLKF